MREKQIYSCLSVLMLICVVWQPGPAWALRCDSKIIDTEELAARVLKLCGEPDLRDEWINRYGHEIQEQWYYNFGPRRLLQILTFRQGRLTKIEADGYGFIKSGQPGNCLPNEILSGMNKLLLLHVCGEPEHIEVVTGYFIPHDAFHKHHHPPAAIFMKREHWFYNFGPRRLRREVVLENGRISHVQTEGYGD